MSLSWSVKKKSLSAINYLVMSLSVFQLNRVPFVAISKIPYRRCRTVSPVKFNPCRAWFKNIWLFLPLKNLSFFSSPSDCPTLPQHLLGTFIPGGLGTKIAANGDIFLWPPFVLDCLSSSFYFILSQNNLIYSELSCLISRVELQIWWNGFVVQHSATITGEQREAKESHSSSTVCHEIAPSKVILTVWTSMQSTLESGKTEIYD